VLWLVYGREEAPRAADVVSEPEPPPYAKGRPLSKEALALAAYYDRLPGEMKGEVEAAMLTICLGIPEEKRGIRIFRWTK